MRTSTLSLTLCLSAILALRAAAATLYVDISNPTPVAPYTNWLTSATNIQDAVDAANLNDLILVTNGIYQTGGRVVSEVLTNRVALTKPVMVQSVNGPVVTAIVGNPVFSDSAVRCVYMTNGATLIGFTLTNGGTRDTYPLTFESYGGGAWCESTSCLLSNCVLVGSVAVGMAGGAYGGTLSTCIISGNHCLGSGGGVNTCILNNCTLTNNVAGGDGGAAAASTLYGCVLSRNSSSYGGGGARWSYLSNCVLSANSGSVGGGACQSTLDNCLLTGNVASRGGGANLSTLNNSLITGNTAYNGSLSTGAASYGGGLDEGTANNCTFVGNSVQHAPRSWVYAGGGASYSVLNNCVLYFNSGSGTPNWAGSPTLTHCCTIPLPSGPGNITNAPLFVDQAGGNYHLQTNSPCINAGNNAAVASLTDLDGNPRIRGGTVDMGAYELQNPTSEISYSWLQQFGLSTDGTVDDVDTDQDGMNNWQEWVAGTDPTTALSVLKMVGASNSLAGVTVSWQGVSSRTYFLQCSTNLLGQPAFSPLQSNIVGQAGTTSFTDTNALGSGPFSYRVGVQ
jgi:hypothetical protein